MNDTKNSPLEDIRDELALLPEQVAHYLRENPSFFEQHPDLLNELTIPHGSGTVSLIERQVSQLRDENTKLKQQLGLLVSNARENDVLLEKSKALTLAIMSEREESAITETLESAMCKDFGADACKLWLIKDKTDTATRMLAQEQAALELARFIGESKPFCGLLKDEETQTLFPQEAEAVGSAAVLPLFGAATGKEDKRPPLIAVLAIANKDKNYYRKNMSTSILSYIGDVVAQQLTMLVG